MNWLRRLFVGTIPRDIHDEIVDDLREQLRDERDRSKKLMRTVVKMKVAGGSIPRVLSPGLKLEPREPGLIDAALDANPRTRTDQRRRATTRAWADRELAKDSSPENERRIAAQIRSHGLVTLDDGDDDDDVIAVSTK